MSTTKNTKEPEIIKGPKFNIESMKESNIIEKETSQLYANVFLINFNRDINIYEYSFTILPETTEEYVISKIFAILSRQIHEKYGNFYRSGKSFYAIKEVSEPKDFTIEKNGEAKKPIVKEKEIPNESKANFIIEEEEYEYKLQVDKKKEATIIKKGQKSNFSQIEEKIIFLIIKEILTTNPNVKVDKDMFYLEKDPTKKEYPQKIVGEGQTYFIYVGYKLSLKQTENGLCLIVGIKNRIKGDLSVYDALINSDCNYGYDMDESIENLVEKRFVPYGSSKSKVIYDIDKDRTPSNTSRNYGKESKNYIDFFKKEFGKEIKHPDQPMILVRVKGAEGELQFNYYVPEFCKLCGINQKDINDFNFMKELSGYTKLNPDTKSPK